MLQQQNAEWNCSATGQAQVHAGEGAGERGAAGTPMRGAMSGGARGASAGDGAQAVRGHTPPTSFVDKSFFYVRHMYCASVSQSIVWVSRL